MADATESSSGEGKIAVIVKPTAAGGSVRYTLDLAPTSSVSELKELLSQHSNIPAAEQRVIYKGQILKDDRTLDSYGIGHEHVLHLVRSRQTGQQSTPAAPAAGSAPAPTAATSMLDHMRGPAGGGLMGMGSPADIMNNPEMMQEMMRSPIMQSFLSNPEMMRSMMNSNPMIQQLMERVPELGQMLNDPNLLRQSLQIASNPALMREHMRHADRAMSNLESMPEGFNALRRMFENVQEPLMNAAATMDPVQAMLGTAAGTGTAAQSTTSNTNTASTTTAGLTDANPNAAPLPNPWAPPATATANAQQPPAFPDFGSFTPDMLAGLGGLGGAGAGDAGARTGPGNVPAGLGGLGLATQVLQDPGMRNMMLSMMSQPGFLDTALNSNPMLRQMVDSNPGMRELLSNPAALQSSMQLIENMSRNAPQGGLPFLPGMAAAGQQGGGNDPMAQLNMLSNMFGGFGGGLGSMGNAAPQGIDPQVHFAAQLTALADMGFTDTQANIRALQATGGNVHAAVDRLLSGV